MSLARHRANGRVVVAHLGSGASMCAMKQRKSVATTMGFTALDGLPMSRRCGSLDPGVVLYLMEEKENDRRRDQRPAVPVIRPARRFWPQRRHEDTAGERRAACAPRRSIFLSIASVASWDRSPPRSAGLDALVFTAGIGEHAPEIRRRVCEKAAWLGLEIDDAANEAGGPRITKADSKISAWVIPTDEDLMIARHTWRLIGESKERTIDRRIAPACGREASMNGTKLRRKS